MIFLCIYVLWVALTCDKSFYLSIFKFKFAVKLTCSLRLTSTSSWNCWIMLYWRLWCFIPSIVKINCVATVPRLSNNKYLQNYADKPLTSSQDSTFCGQSPLQQSSCAIQVHHILYFMANICSQADFRQLKISRCARKKFKVHLGIPWIFKVIFIR
jgi:hypothetical protein